MTSYALLFFNTLFTLCFVVACADTSDQSDTAPQEPPVFENVTTSQASVDGFCAISQRYELRMRGPQSGPTVLFLTGFPGDAFWLEKGAGLDSDGNLCTLQSCDKGAASYIEDSNAFQIVRRLFDAGFRIVEQRWLDIPTDTCEGRSSGFYDAYTYVSAMVATVFSNVPIDDRFVIGHSWGAMSIGILEIPSLAVPIRASAALAPNGADLVWGCQTALDSVSGQYIGGWANWFLQNPTDTYDDAFPFRTTTRLLGLGDDCHNSLIAQPGLEQILRDNSIALRAEDEGANLAPDGSGHEMFLIGGDLDWGFHDIDAYRQQRSLLGGIGRAEEITGGTHSMNQWPAEWVNSVVAFFEERQFTRQ